MQKTPRNMPFFQRNGGRTAMCAALIMAGALMAGAETKVISVNWKQFAEEPNDVVGTYGVVPAGNWVNSRNGLAFTNLPTSDGGTSTVGMSLEAGSTGTYYGGLDNTPMRAGQKVDTDGGFRTLTVSGLSGTFSTYDIIVYVAGYNGANNTAVVAVDSEIYFCKVPNPFTTALIQSTDSEDDDTDAEGTYVRFNGLSGDMQFIDIERQGGEIAIGGIQIVGEAVPPPPVEGPISINWKEFAGTINDPIEPYGVVAASNWYNFTGAGGASNLITSGGGATTVDVSITAPGGLGTFFNGALANRPMRSGVESFNPANGPDIVLSDLSATFLTYDIIVYVTGFNGAAGGNQGSVTDGTTTRYFQVPNPYSGALTESTDTDIGDGADVATYVRFDGLTADSTTISLRQAAGGGVAIGGLQITGEFAPPPAGEITIVSVDRDAVTGEVTVVFASESGSTYSAFGGTDLDDTGAWPEISTGDIVDAGGTASFSHTPAGDPAVYFLQIRED